MISMYIVVKMHNTNLARKNCRQYMFHHTSRMLVYVCVFMWHLWNWWILFWSTYITYYVYPCCYVCVCVLFWLLKFAVTFHLLNTIVDKFMPFCTPKFHININVCYIFTQINIYICLDEYYMSENPMTGYFWYGYYYFYKCWTCYQNNTQCCKIYVYFM